MNTASQSAWIFDAPHTLAGIQARLDERSPWRWQMGDSAWLGDYLYARTDGSGESLRLYRERNRFVLELRRSPKDTPTRSLVQDLILPLLDASFISPHPGFD